MNLVGSFFVILLGTQTPVGFTDVDVACRYLEARPKAKMFVYYQQPVQSCYAIENGCELAERARQAEAPPMMQVTCSWREERKKVLEVKFK